ncbi:MAG: hypothetical protein J7M34_13340 [Anaerolineae bacterium]|nr:hypothetical protein [Anaerolineae bacterium]
MSRPPGRWTQLLTIWLERPASTGRLAAWRFALEDVHSGERHGFASLEALVAFLQEQMASKEAGEESG